MIYITKNPSCSLPSSQERKKTNVVYNDSMVVALMHFFM